MSNIQRTFHVNFFLCILIKNRKVFNTVMNASSTPISVSSSKKRELQSPEELAELKKNKLAETESDISDLSIMSNTEEKGASEVATQSVIQLDSTNMETIAELLKSSFQPQIAEMVTSIVNGVLEGLQSAISATTLENRRLSSENKELKTRVADLEAKVDAAEQYSRRNCLRVAGVPEPTNGQTENTDEYIVNLTRDLGVEVELNDIERSHRIGKPRALGRPRDIIVKFVSYRIRRKVYGVRTQTKVKGFMGVYINEDLTKPRSQLLRKARNMVKNRNLVSAWSSDGTILVRDQKDTIHRIQCENDLVQFGPVPVFPDARAEQADHPPIRADQVFPQPADASEMDH